MAGCLPPYGKKSHILRTNALRGEPGQKQEKDFSRMVADRIDTKIKGQRRTQLCLESSGDVSEARDQQRTGLLTFVSGVCGPASDRHSTFPLTSALGNGL